MNEKNTEQLLTELLAYQKKEVRHTRIASLAEVDTLIGEAGTLINNTNSMVETNTDAVTDTIQKLNEVDFEGLNSAIQNLNDVVEPLSNFARMFQ